MLWFLADQDATLTVDYVVDGEFVIPATATFTLRNAAGAVIHSGSLPAAATSEQLTIPAAYNGLTGQTEGRFLEIQFLSAGRHYARRLPYRLTNFVPLTVTPEEVRSLLGLDASELRDEEIDLIGAYYKRLWTDGDTFATGITAGDQRGQAANDAVALTAALEVAGSLPMRTRILVRAEDSQVQRSANIDFDALRRDLTSRLEDTLRISNQLVEEDQTVFILTQPTDVITG